MRVRENAASPGILSEKFASNKSKSRLTNNKKSGGLPIELNIMKKAAVVNGAAARKSVTPQKTFRIMSEREKKRLERKFEGTELNEEKLQ